MDAKTIAKVAYKTAQILLAASSKEGKRDLADTLKNERYQRTFTDEYPFRKKSRAGFKPISDEQKEMRRLLHEGRGDGIKTETSATGTTAGGPDTGKGG